MKSFYFNTFARVCMIPYIGGTVVHILRLIYDFDIREAPMWIDWLLVIIGGYGGLGLIIFANKVPFKNNWDKLVYGLLIFHLDTSVIVHAYVLYIGNHDLLSIFPYWYSFIAVAYFIGLGIYVKSLIQRISR